MKKICALGEQLKTEVYVCDNQKLSDVKLYEKNSSREFSEKILEALTEGAANKNSLTIDPFGFVYSTSEKTFGSVRNDTLKNFWAEKIKS